jgi:hypothetical protein
MRETIENAMPVAQKKQTLNKGGDGKLEAGTSSPSPPHCLKI